MQKEINKFENERNEIERCLYFLNGILHRKKEN